MDSDIRLAELTLEGIRAVRESSPSADPQSVLIDGCLRVTKLLTRNLGVDGASLYHVSRRGDIVKSYTHGVSPKGPVDDHALLFGRTRDPSFVVLPIPIESRKTYLAKAVFGYLTLYRESPLTKPEQRHVSEMIRFLAHFVQYAWDFALDLRSEALRKSIDRILETESRPGSIVATVLQAIHRGVQARATYFGVIHGDALWIDYFYDTTFHTVPPSQGQSVPSRVTALVRHTDTFLWSDESDMLLVQQLLTHFDSRSPHGSNYLIGVYRSDSDPIGLLILEFDKMRYFSEKMARDILLYRNQDIGKYVGFLFQRRTERMIANPIFRSRDTKIDPLSVFVLMPFTEDWSDRIWTRVIRPTVEAEGLRPMRADDLYGRDIMEDVWQGSYVRGS